MKVLAIHRKLLRNEEHFMFHKNVIELIEKNGADALGIEEFFPAYKALFQQELTAINVLRKNHLSEALAKADKRRDRIYTGFKKYINALTYHFNPETAKAAKVLEASLKTYRQLTDKPYDQESGMLNYITHRLITKDIEALKLLNATEWVDALSTANEDFEELKRRRYTSEVNKTPLKMKDVRVDIDACYLSIVNHVEAQILLNNPEACRQWVKKLNSMINYFRNIISIREGKQRSKNPSDG